MQLRREANSHWHGIVMFAYAVQGSKANDREIWIFGYEVMDLC